MQVRLAGPGGRRAGRCRLRALDFDWSAAVEGREGHAEFSAVPPGRHELTVERPGAADGAARWPSRAAYGGVVTATLAGERLVGHGDGHRSAGRGHRASARGCATCRRAATHGRCSRRPSPWPSPTAWTRAGCGRDGRDATTAHGTSLTQAGFRFAGAEAVDPLGNGLALFDPDLAWVSSLRLATALLPASAAGAGPVLAAYARRPGQELVVVATADFAHIPATCHPADGRRRSRGSTTGHPARWWPPARLASASA